MGADGIGMRASQEARWKRNVKATRERQRRLHQIEKEKREAEELKRKEALERRRRERAESDQYLRHPKSKPPEPKKPILRKGAGGKRHGSRTKDCVRPASPRTNAKKMQARIRDHIREQRQKVLLKNQAAEVNGPCIEDDGIDWQTARKMAARRLENLLHDVLPEPSPATRKTADISLEMQSQPDAWPQAQRGIVSEEFEFPQPTHDLSALLKEMGPPKGSIVSEATDAARDDGQRTGEASMFCFNVRGDELSPIMGNHSDVQQTTGLRRGMTSTARHRPMPQQWAEEQAQNAEPLQELPEVESALENADRRCEKSDFEIEGQSSPMPEWASLVDHDCNNGENCILPANQVEQVPAWATMVPVCFATSTCDSNPADGETMNAKVWFPEKDDQIHSPDSNGEAASKKISLQGLENSLEQTPGGHDKVTGTETNSRETSLHTSVGDSAKSFDFGLASSGRFVANLLCHQTDESFGPRCHAASEEQSKNISTVSPKFSRMNETPGSAVSNERPSPKDRVALLSPSTHEASEPLNVAVASNLLHDCMNSEYAHGLEAQDTLAVIYDQSHKRGPAVSHGKQSTSTDTPSASTMTPTHSPGEHGELESSVVERSKESGTHQTQASTTMVCEPAPGYADGNGVIRRKTRQYQAVVSMEKEAVLKKHQKDSIDGVDGRRECKGSYAAAALAANQRQQQEKMERDRLAVELAKRRADVAAREAKERDRRPTPKCQQPRGHYAAHIPGQGPPSSTKLTKPNPPKHQAPPGPPNYQIPVFPPAAQFPNPLERGFWSQPFHGQIAYPLGHGANMICGGAHQYYSAVPGTSAVGMEKQSSQASPVQIRPRESVAQHVAEGDEVKAMRQLDMSIELSEGDLSGEGEDLPDDWEAQVDAAAPSRAKHTTLRDKNSPHFGSRPQSSNFSRSPLAAALLELVGLPGIHGMDPFARQVRDRDKCFNSAELHTGLSMEEDALLKSLRRIDPNILRKSLKSAGIICNDLGSCMGTSKQEQDLLRSLENLDRRLKAVNMKAADSTTNAGDTSGNQHRMNLAKSGTKYQSAQDKQRHKEASLNNDVRHKKTVSPWKGSKASQQNRNKATKPCLPLNAGVKHLDDNQKHEAGVKDLQYEAHFQRSKLHREEKDQQPFYKHWNQHQFPVMQAQYAAHAAYYPAFPVFHQQQQGKERGVVICPIEPSSLMTGLARQTRSKSAKKLGSSPPEPTQVAAVPVASLHQQGRIKMNNEHMMGLLFE